MCFALKIPYIMVVFDIESDRVDLITVCNLINSLSRKLATRLQRFISLTHLVKPKIYLIYRIIQTGTCPSLSLFRTHIRVK